ncbi:MAG TPA: DUF6298 domain-containing protein [Chthoniobacterales bacterium]
MRSIRPDSVRVGLSKFKALALAGLWASIATCGNASEATPKANPGESVSSLPGPLRVLKTNPRYFTADGSTAVYLTGSHTWSDLQDMTGGSDPGVAINSYNGCDSGEACFRQFLSWAKRHNHNFIRLWRAEHTYNGTYRMTPHPYARTGPGTMPDGGLKFDLNTFDQNYFDRLRSRCVAAENAGFYVSIMLFDEGGVENATPWENNPFNIGSNINGVNGELGRYRLGIGTHTMSSSSIVKRQEAYIRKVIDTVNDLNNIVYEVANESSTQIAWQNHVIDYIRAYEGGKSKQHPIGTNIGGGKRGEINDAVLLGKCHADFVGPNCLGAGNSYDTDPPMSSGARVIISDTDHIFGIGGDTAWVWKTFTRGLNPIYMDPYFSNAQTGDEGARWAMGDTLSYARRMNLATMTPSNSSTSTSYSLVNSGGEYLAYNPGAGNITIKSLPTGTYTYEWFNTLSRITSVTFTESVTSTGPFTPANASAGMGNVLYLKKSTTGVEAPVKGEK